jgi:cellulose synthase/poly-beta-1,6-N-acetylglucosamine synthase-like glycosyltransferase
MKPLFFIFAGLSLYSYLLYPISLMAISRLVRRVRGKSDIRPTVTMLISVYNEERIIAEKIENALALDYPGGQLEIVVISDGSTDGTNQIVRSVSDSRLLLKAFPKRSGKSACLNWAVSATGGEILLFTDANSMFPENILLSLVKNFADPDIGLVTGWTKYGGANQSEDTTGVYSRFEKWTKLQECAVSSCVGADGAVFAMRKQLYQTLREDDLNDFVIPLNVVRQGKRVVVDPDVFCVEFAPQGAENEYRRQVRITTRTLGAIRRNLEFLNPFRYGLFSYFLLSHKIMRFLTPFFLLTTFGSNLVLLERSVFYKATFVGQLTILFIGLCSALGVKMGRGGSVVASLLVTLLAQLVAWFRTFAGISDTMWNPQR